MASSSQEEDIIINALPSIFTDAINETNPARISSFSMGWVRGWGRSTPSDCPLPICIKAYEIKMQTPPPPPTSPLKLAKLFVGLTFQAIVGLFISQPTSVPPRSTFLIEAAMFIISFVVLFAALFLQNALPRMALLLEKIGALFAATGVCFIAELLLIHPSFGWICWLGWATSVLAVVISLFK